MTKIAAVQMASGAQVQANLMKAGELIQQAAAQDANLVVLPENFALMGKNEKDHLQIAEYAGQGIIQDFLAKQAKQYGLWILGGSIPLRLDDTLANATPSKVSASALLFNDQGEQVARYDKMHLFDARLPNGDVYAESDTTQPGFDSMVIDTPFGKLGIAICYDLRFPELFREMSAEGAQIFAIPAAFTDTTGKAHWEVLLRARAIENLSYVIAAGQGGYHVNGKATYGHSMIIDYWGNVREVLEKGEGVIVSTIDLNTLDSVRTNFPVLEHRELCLAL
jgi:predicted amidohydrolase